MRSRFVTVLALSFAFASCGSLTLRAQDASVASRAAIDSCVQWMKATVSVGVAGPLDPTEFCSGIKRGNIGGWYSMRKCGHSTGSLNDATPGYCTSSGQLTAHEAWAASFSTATTPDGHELLDGTSDSAKDLHRSAATFYSRTPVWMGMLRLPAGMYELTPAKSPDGWKLDIAKQHGEYLGSVEMKTATSDDPAGKNLVISTKHWGEGCRAQSRDLNVRELDFSYGNINLFVCLRPDQVSFSQEENISHR
jgi:hypothetical protein